MNYNELRERAKWLVKAFDYWSENERHDPQAWDSFCTNIELLRALLEDKAPAFTAEGPQEMKEKAT